MRIFFLCATYLWLFWGDVLNKSTFSSIRHESESELLFLKKVLESSVFNYYMRNSSKPYSAGYYSYAKNYVKNFGMYPFSDEQKSYVLAMNTQAEVDAYIQSLYRINI